ncbi:hypothetical protein C5S31_02520, partial [ANME-1 cluster archaeon GoMg2]|nr:hypothetical protein [ANME-1 cluster archaeon GoMg2]
MVSVGEASELAGKGTYSNYQYQKAITIRENSGKTLEDYQVILIFSGSTFPVNANADGSDLRFVLAGKELSYWIEEFDSGAKTGKVWLKVPNIPASGTVTVLMYYGKSDVSSQSNGDKTFYFFDAFSTDKGYWKTGGVTYTISNGILDYTGSGCQYIVETGVLIPDNVVIEALISILSVKRGQNVGMTFSGSSFDESMNDCVTKGYFYLFATTLKRVRLWRQPVNEGMHLFSMDIGLEVVLNDCIVSEALKEVFKTNGFSLSEKIVITKENELKWVIADGKKKCSYVIRKEEDKLNVYKRNMDIVAEKTNYTVPTDKKLRWKVVKAGKKIEGWIEGTKLIDFTDPTPLPTPGYIGFREGHLQVDFVFVRKYAFQEPTVRFSIEPDELMPREDTVAESEIKTDSRAGMTENVANLNFEGDESMQNERIKSLIEEIVIKNELLINTFPFYLHGHIPKKKLNNALAYISKGIKEIEILFFVDFTVLGSGKRGLVFTRDKLFWRTVPNKGMIKYTGINSVSVNGSYELVINSTKILMGPTRKRTELVSELIMQITREKHAKEKSMEQKKENEREGTRTDAVKVIDAKNHCVIMDTVTLYAQPIKITPWLNVSKLKRGIYKPFTLTSALVRVPITDIGETCWKTAKLLDGDASIKLRDLYSAKRANQLKLGCGNPFFIQIRTKKLTILLDCWMLKIGSPNNTNKVYISIKLEGNKEEIEYFVLEFVNQLGRIPDDIHYLSDFTKYTGVSKEKISDMWMQYSLYSNSISSANEVIRDVKSMKLEASGAEDLLNKAKSSLDNGKYKEAFELSKQAEEVALWLKKDFETKELSKYILSLESEITAIKSTGVKIPKSEELIAQAKSDLKNNFENAKELASEAKIIASERKEYYEKALKSVSSANATLNAAKSVEIEVSNAENLLNKAKSLSEEGKYEEAFELSNQAEEEVLGLKKDYETYKVSSEYISSLESEITAIKNTGVKIPKYKELIVQAKSELTKNNFESAKNFAEEAKRIAYERRGGYDLAFRLIFEAERILNETKTKGGVMVSTDLLTKSKQACDNGDYDESVRLSKELKNLASDRERIYQDAQEAIRAAESSIENAKEFGCNVSDVEERLKSAELLFAEGAYERIVKASKQIEEQTKKIMEEAKPEITIKLSETSFKPNAWKRIDLIFKNSGTATTKEINVEYPGDRVDIEGLMAIGELKPNDEKKLKIDFRPKQVGEVPLTATITYMDLDNKEYKEETRFRISVGEELQRRVEDHENPTEQKEITIERAIYDSCKRDFIERALPRMKEWINRYDPGAYWFAISIQNNTDRSIEEWDIDLEMSSALKVSEVKIEGIEREIPQEAHLGLFKISVPKEYGIVIPKGGTQRVYFKLRADKPKTTYEISGVFKSAIGEVPIRAKEFKYLCDVRMSPEAVKPELKKAFSEKDAVRLALSFKTVQEIDRMCNRDARTEEYQDKLSALKNYTEGFSEDFTKQVDEFSMFMKEEQLTYLDDEYKPKVRRFCTNLVDVWIR